MRGRPSWNAEAHRRQILDLIAEGCGVMELGRRLGVNYHTCVKALDQLGIPRPDKRSENMRRLHANQAFAASHRERNRERMRRLNQDPTFAARRDERIRKLHQDPQWESDRIDALRRAAAFRRLIKKLEALDESTAA